MKAAKNSESMRQSQGVKINCWLGVGCVERSFSSQTFPLDRRADQDTWCLVWSQSLVGNELVGGAKEGQPRLEFVCGHGGIFL